MAPNNVDILSMKERCKELKEALAYRYYGLKTALSPNGSDSESDNEIDSP